LAENAFEHAAAAEEESAQLLAQWRILGMIFAAKEPQHQSLRRFILGPSAHLDG